MFMAFWLHPIPPLHPPSERAKINANKEKPTVKPTEEEPTEDLIIWPVSSQYEAPRNLQAEFKRVCAENGYFESPYETLQELQDWHRETYGCDEYVQ